MVYSKAGMQDEGYVCKCVGGEIRPAHLSRPHVASFEISILRGLLNQ